MAVQSVEFAVQKAIDAVLAPVLGALAPAVPLYDHLPQNAAFPFVQFSRVIATPDHLLASDMMRVQIALTVFSTFRGQEQVLEILGAITAALDKADLTLEKGRAVRCDRERADTVRDTDGVTYTGSALFNVLVDQS